MIFRLDTVSNNYTKEEWEKLEAMGFRHKSTCVGHTGQTLYTKDDKHEPNIEFKTIEQLVEFIARLGDEVIMSKDRIIIYDGYCE